MAFKRLYLSVVRHGMVGFDLVPRCTLFGNEKSNHPTLTVLIDEEKGNIAYSTCSEKDNFCKQTGVIKASGRMEALRSMRGTINGADTICNHQINGLCSEVERFVKRYQARAWK